MRRILAVDLGGDTGVAYNLEGDGRLQWETWSLSSNKELEKMRRTRLNRRNDLRVQRFFQLLTLVKMRQNPEVVVFEDVQFRSSTFQTQLWSSYRTALWLTFPPDRFYVDCVPVGTLKHFATKNGAADKSMMARALSRAMPERFKMSGQSLVDTTADSVTVSDDAVDAIWLWLWARQNLERV